MAEFPAMPLWTDRYLADTRHLTRDQHGAYLLLLMEAWRRPRCSLPDDDVMLAGMACASLAEWAVLKPTIMAFWKLDKRTKEWTQKGQLRERKFVQENRERQRARARKRWNKEEKDGAAALQACKAPTPTPTPTKKESEAIASEARRRARKPELPIPENWCPSERNVADAEARHFSPQEIAHEADRFRNHHLAKGSLFRDWDAAWRTWLGGARRFNGGGGMAGVALGGGRQLGGSMASIAARRRAEGTV